MAEIEDHGLPLFHNKVYIKDYDDIIKLGDI